MAAALAGAEVLLYSAPSGRPETARAYAEAALHGGCRPSSTPPPTRSPAIRGCSSSFEAAGLPLLGDDLASQFGTSVVHNALLRLLEERGLTLISSYQVNLGGTEDFRNLVENPNTKKQSKLNALSGARHGVEVAPLGYLPHLRVAEGGSPQHRGAGLGRDGGEPRREAEGARPERRRRRQHRPHPHRGQRATERTWWSLRRGDVCRRTLRPERRSQLVALVPRQGDRGARRRPYE